MRTLPLLAVAAAAWAGTPSEVVERAGASVLRVEAEGRPLAPELEAMLGRLPKPAGVTPGGQRGQRGTGVVVDGGVLTSHHVVAGAAAVTLVGPDGDATPARVVAFDASFDLALLQPSTPADGRPPIPMGDSAALRMGAPVLVLGFPLGDQPVATRGVLSGRTERSLLGRGRHTYLLTDALIQRGASGGPLLDEEGRMVGLVTGGLEGDADGAGLGFVLPVEAVGAALERLAQRRPMQRLGVAVAEVEAGLAVTRSLRPELQVGDVLQGVDDRPVPTRLALADAVQRMTDGPLQVVGSREGAPATWSLEPWGAPDGPPYRWRGLGLEPDGDGLRVLSVTEQAARMGLDPGDRIVALADRALDGRTLRRQLQETPPLVALTVAGKGLVWMLPPG